MEEEHAVVEVIRSGWLASGPHVAQLEEKFATFAGGRYGVACSSGSAALQLALESLRLKRDAGVLVPSLTFSATASAVKRARGRCVFGDIVSPTELTLNAAHWERPLASKIEAVLFVTYGGYSGSLAQVHRFCESAGVPLIIDACHSPGLRLNGSGLGNVGTCSIFSFHSTKNITGGEGGMLVTNSEALWRRAICLRGHGLERYPSMDPSGCDYRVAEVGWNARMSELVAAVVEAQLVKLPAFSAKRVELSILYDQELQGCGLLLPFSQSRKSSVAHLYPVVLPSKVSRRDVRAYLAAHGIETGVHYVPLHLQPAFRSTLRPLALPLTESLAPRLLSIPLHPKMSPQDVKYVASSLKDAMARMTVG